MTAAPGAPRARRAATLCALAAAAGMTAGFLFDLKAFTRGSQNMAVLKDVKAFLARVLTMLGDCTMLRAT